MPLAQRAPPTRPAPVTPSTDGQVCAVYQSTASASPTVVYGRDVPVPYTAGLVRLPLGSGAVVQSSSAAAGSDNGLYFISDGGVEFPIGADALTKLGLDSVAPGPRLERGPRCDTGRPGSDGDGRAHAERWWPGHRPEIGSRPVPEKTSTVTFTPSGRDSK